VKVKKNARILCVNNKEFWTTQKRFWQWVREGQVDLLSHQPLTGKFLGRRETLLVMVRHVVLDNACPNHKEEILYRYSKLKPHIAKPRS
jgi:hypothetical protein